MLLTVAWLFEVQPQLPTAAILMLDAANACKKGTLLVVIPDIIIAIIRIKQEIIRILKQNLITLEVLIHDEIFSFHNKPSFTILYFTIVNHISNSSSKFCLPILPLVDSMITLKSSISNMNIYVLSIIA